MKRRWRFKSRDFFCRNAKATVCSFTPHMTTENSTKPTDQIILAVGFSSGVFALYLLSTSSLSVPFVNIHSLSMGKFPITAASVNRTGEWV
jgi:hypothetical protein